MEYLAILGIDETPKKKTRAAYAQGYDKDVITTQAAQPLLVVMQRLSQGHCVTTQITPA